MAESVGAQGRWQRRPTVRGMTLIEIMTTVVILGVLSTVGAAMMVESVKAWNQFIFRADTGMQARFGLDEMVREIRETDVDDSIGGPIIATADARTYDFTHTLTSSTAEAVNFSWNNTAGAPLLRNADTLIPRVTALAFAYYDKTGASLTPLPLTAAQRDLVRRVVVTLTIQNDTNTADTMKLKGEAFLRSPFN